MSIADDRRDSLEHRRATEWFRVAPRGDDAAIAPDQQHWPSVGPEEERASERTWRRPRRPEEQRAEERPST